MNFHFCDDKDSKRRERTVFAILAAAKILPPERFEFMVNYRVDNLEESVRQLQSNGITIEKTEDHDYGRFAWIRDPEGNRIELWQPPAN